MTLRAEYYTKISDYDLSVKQEVFYVLSRQKYDSEVMSEKIPVPADMYLDKEIPIDSKIAWRISPFKKQM